MTYSLAEDLFIKCYLEYMKMKKYLLPLIGKRRLSTVWQILIFLRG